MINKNRFTMFAALAVTAVVTMVVTTSCSTTHSTKQHPKKQSSDETISALPLSDPNNLGNWVLNPEVSDEFNAESLDTNKWFVEGQNGDYYIWKGRPPSQFAPHNVLVEDGMLKIRSQWEPDYPFIKESYADGNNNDTYGVYEGEPMPVTTGAVISKKRFLNGYMEVRSKAADAAMTSSFWAIGYESELDVYEQMGRPKIDGDIKENTLKASIHDWRPPAKRPTRKFGHKTELPFRVADEFHIYGVEWAEDYIRFYLDGEMISETTQEEVGRHWVLTNPIEIWFDSEIFKWIGLPHKEELPVDYEIDYLRIWQKPTNNVLARHFYGFEGPYLFEENEKPLTLVPENSENNAYQQFWRINQESSKALSIVRHEKHSSGTRSLKFSTAGEAASARAKGPEGALDLDIGQYNLKLKLWLEPGSTADSIVINLPHSNVALKPFKIKGLASGKWHELTQSFTKSEKNNKPEFMSVSVHKKNASSSATTLFIDDIAIDKQSTH